MRLVMMSIVLVAGVAVSAHAQEAKNPQTFGSQIERLRAGEAAVPAPWVKKPSKPLQIDVAENINRDPVGNPAPIIYADSADDFATKAAQLAPAAGGTTAPKQAPITLAQAATAPTSLGTSAPVPSTTPYYGRMVTTTQVGDAEYLHDEPIDSVGGGAIPALPLKLMKSDNGLEYLTGGVGDEELDQLKSQGGNYNLHLLISAVDGAYMSNAQLRITDKKGTDVLTAANVGPYVLVNLPVGTYNIEVTSYKGETKKTTAKVPAKGFVKPQVRF